MEQLFAKNLMKDLKIDASRLVQEEWEMKILKILFDSPLGKKLIFKGGTALRLTYNSPRFSEDLDFSLTSKLSESLFEKILRKIEDKYPELSISEIRHKFYTHFCLFKIKESWLPQIFSVKIEVSKRQKEEKSEIKTLTSPTTTIQVITRVQTLDQILKDKLQAAKTRAEPRDLFDIWYIYQVKRLPEKLPKSTIPEIRLKSELRKFLPKNYWLVINQIRKEIK